MPSPPALRIRSISPIARDDGSGGRRQTTDEAATAACRAGGPLAGLFVGDLRGHGTDVVDFFTRKKTVSSRWLSSGQGSGSYLVER
jgi:hypothetical protein